MNTIKVHQSIGMRGSWEKFGNQWGFTIDIREATLFFCERLLLSIGSDDDGEVIDVIVLFGVCSNAREDGIGCAIGWDNAGVGTYEDFVVGCCGIKANSIDEDGGTAADAALGCDDFGGRAGD